jgi:2-polyprenyl-3-methyl-5-hydroxy-6-metoxy-1,4-benzoquinol methylase
VLKTKKYDRFPTQNNLNSNLLQAKNKKSYNTILLEEHMDNRIKEIKEAVDAAQEAVYHSQLNNDSKHLQSSLRAIFQAEQLLNEWYKGEHDTPPADIQHAKEMLRNLKETQAAVNALHAD